MGDQVVPAFTVFHTPPECTATYHTLRLPGWMAISPIRPEVIAGPMERNRRPPNCDARGPGPPPAESALVSWRAGGAPRRAGGVPWARRSAGTTSAIGVRAERRVMRGILWG